MSKIYLINGANRMPIAGLIAGAVRDAVDSENIISLTLYGTDAMNVTATTTVECNGQYYDVVELQLYMNGFTPMADVTAENVIYRLNSRTVRASTSGPTSGSVAQLMMRALSNGTYIFIDPNPTELSEFTFGRTDISLGVNFYAPAGMCSRREMINAIAKAAGGEIEVSGYTVNVWAHRGATAAKELLGGYHVQSVRTKTDYRTGTTSYDIELLKKSDLQAGDNVHIKFDPLGIDVTTRIIAVEYNPYNPYEVSIDVGDYEPDIKDLFVK
jgi:hypothetical protein